MPTELDTLTPMQLEALCRHYKWLMRTETTLNNDLIFFLNQRSTRGEPIAETVRTWAAQLNQLHAGSDATIAAIVANPLDPLAALAPGEGPLPPPAPVLPGAPVTIAQLSAYPS